MNSIIAIYEDTAHKVVFLRCKHCGAKETVETLDAKKAYISINRFRGCHQHLETLRAN